MGVPGGENKHYTAGYTEGKGREGGLIYSTDLFFKKVGM